MELEQDISLRLKIVLLILAIGLIGILTFMIMQTEKYWAEAMSTEVLHKTL